MKKKLNSLSINILFHDFVSPLLFVLEIIFMKKREELRYRILRFYNNSIIFCYYYYYKKRWAVQGCERVIYTYQPYNTNIWAKRTVREK